MNKKQFAIDAYALEDDCVQEHADSSDDDLNAVLPGIREQCNRLCERRGGSELSGEDEFEREMKAELNHTMRKLEASYTGLAAEKKAVKRPVQSNDDLYDPCQDEVDQKWVDSLRGQYQPVAGKQSLPPSDAILNCPCCMVTLCLDCQRHAIYQHQYRAMFVMNCIVRTNEELRFPTASGPKVRKTGTKHYKSDDQENSSQARASSSECVATPSGEDIFHPVTCSECNTEVAVYDCEEIYHFFNVLASHA